MIIILILQISNLIKMKPNMTWFMLEDWVAIWQKGMKEGLCKNLLGLLDESVAVCEKSQFHGFRPAVW